MQSLFLDTRVLDAATRKRYGLTEELMMENAAAALERAVVQHLGLANADARQTQVLPEEKNPRVVAILCGSGNNGADGYALSRRLAGLVVAEGLSAVPVVIAVSEPKSDLCKVQAERSKKCGVQIASAETLFRADIIVDCIFGSGFHGALDARTAELCAHANKTNAKRISCDVPTGVCKDGTVADGAFCADCTVTMGALKFSLYSDAAKDFVGQIVCENLGVSRALFEKDAVPAAHLLQADDVRLPYRASQLVNKGSFGHVAVASGEKIGASCIAGQAALRFGAGLVSLVRLSEPFSQSELPQVTPELMTASDFPANTTAAAVGMGLGRNDEKVQSYFDWLSAHSNIPCVIDADACHANGLLSFLQKRATGIVLTPHPKEFSVLLHNCCLGNYAISDCVHARPRLMEQFCYAFPHVVLLVKGANPMIATFDGAAFRLFVNPLGTNALAKAGSGDVLAGLIAALLAQGRDPLDATINASLSHALASRQFKNDFSLTPFSLIDAVAEL